MHVDWWTLSLQVVNFLVLVWLLRRFLFRPVKDVVARRKELAAAASGKLEQARKEVEEEKHRYEQARRELTEERSQLGAKMHDELAQERERTVKQAREEAEKMVADARDRIVDERRSVLEALRGEVADLAAGMAGHLLADASPQTYGKLLLERIGQRLEHLSEREKRQLEVDLAVHDTVMTVTTAVPLDEAARQKWSKRLHELLATSASIEFKTDADLIAGAILELPHAAIEFSWADQLEAARDRVSAT